MSSIIISNGSIKPDQNGSIQELVKRLTDEFSDDNDITLVCRRVGEQYPRYEETQEATIHRLKAPCKKSTWHFLFPIYSIINSYLVGRNISTNGKVDIAIHHNPFIAFGLIMSGVVKERRFFHMHHPKYEEISRELRQLNLSILAGLVSYFVWIIEYYVIRKADVVVHHSDFIRDKTRMCFNTDLDKFFKIRPGVDYNFFDSGTSRKKSRLNVNIPVEKTVLFTLRGEGSRYGLTELVHAFNIVKNTCQGTMLVIGGAGGDNKRVRRTIRDCDLGGSIQTPGYIEQDRLPDYYRAADFFILPTRALEGFGYVILESMSCNTPVLGTPVGAIPEVLSEFDEELLFDDLDPRTMASGIISVIQADRVGWKDRNFRSIVKSKFDWEDKMSRYRELVFGTQ